LTKNTSINIHLHIFIRHHHGCRRDRRGIIMPTFDIPIDIANITIISLGIELQRLTPE